MEAIYCNGSEAIFYLKVLIMQSGFTLNTANPNSLKVYNDIIVDESALHNDAL